jgi:hypothetical protein
VRLTSSHYKALLLAVAAVLVPTLVVGGASIGYWRAVTTSSGRTSALATVAEVVGLTIVVLGTFLAEAAGVHAATSAALGAEPDWKASLRAAASQWVPVVTTGIFVSVFAGLGLVLFVLPGVVLWLTWYVSMPVVVMEHVGTREALRRSAQLVRGRKLVILGAFVLVELLVIACSLPVGAIAGVIFSHSRVATVVAQQVGAYVVEILMTPLQVALVLVVYLDQRLRRDGVDPSDVAKAAGIVGAGARLELWGLPGAGLDLPWPAQPVPPPSPQEMPPSEPRPASKPVAPTSSGWPKLSPKPSADGAPRIDRGSSGPQVSPKPAPPRAQVRPAVSASPPIGASSDVPHDRAEEPQRSGRDDGDEGRRSEQDREGDGGVRGEDGRRGEDGQPQPPSS